MSPAINPKPHTPVGNRLQCSGAWACMLHPWLKCTCIFLVHGLCLQEGFRHMLCCIDLGPSLYAALLQLLSAPYTSCTFFSFF